MINAKQLRELLVRPVLQDLGLWSSVLEELCLATAAQESQMGTYIHQLGAGPALGIFQMEPNTYNDIWTNYLAYHTDLSNKVRGWMIVTKPGVDQLVGNLYLSIAMTACLYHRAKDPLPTSTDVQSLWLYYKKWYNTPQGAATLPEFVGNYNKYVLGK